MVLTNSFAKLMPWIDYYFHITKIIVEPVNIFNLKDFTVAAVFNFILFTTAWIISIFTNDITLIDYCWGFGLAIQSFYYLVQSINYTGVVSIPKLVFSYLIFLNGMRLACYLIIRSQNKQEDKRYAYIRNKVGKYFWLLSYPILFLPQACINSVLGLSIYAFDDMNHKLVNFPLLSFGIFLMFSGTLLQSISDYQLYNFKTNNNNKGKIFDQGLWSLCRHPNYLGDTINWWGIYLCNLSVGVSYTIICPIIFTTGIIFVQGIPIHEYFMKKDYGKAYEEYVNKIPMFIPNVFNKGISSAPAMTDGNISLEKEKKKMKKKINFKRKKNGLLKKNNKILSIYFDKANKQIKYGLNINRKNFHRVQ